MIKQVLSGNLNAFTFLVKKHQKLVSHLIYRIIHQKEDVEDLSQEVFIKVYRNLKNYRGDSKLSTWIATIAYNTAISWYRKKSISEETELPETQQIVNPGLEAQEIMEKNELKRLILKKVEELPGHYRTIVTLYHLEEFSYKEIEEITGLPEGTVKTHLFRARKLLKEKLSFVNIKSEGVEV